MINVGEDDTVSMIKNKVTSHLGVHPSEQKLFFAGKQLEDDKTRGDYGILKESTIHLLPKLPKGGRVDAPQPQPMEGGAGSSSSEIAATDEPVLRLQKPSGDPEFDWSDGWAVAEKLDVRSAQEWYRQFREHNTFEEWKGGNKLRYLLNKADSFHYEVADFLQEKMGNTAMTGSCLTWPAVPQCILAVDKQLRAVLRDPRHEQVPLLGDAESGAFVLGFAQVSNMPTPLRTDAPHSELDRARAEQAGRRLGLHNDSAAYGDVIITTTLFGHVQILLRKDPAIKSELQGVERGQGSREGTGDVPIHAGDAYALWGKARWKMLHDAIVPPTSPPIANLGNLARVGVTLRYFRRSFLELRRRSRLPPTMSMIPALPSPFDYVDAPFYYLSGILSSSHLYTYPAVVLRVDRATSRLTILYVSDGLGADTDTEAFAHGTVPASEVMPAASSVQILLTRRDCSWTRRSLSLVQHIRDMGVDAYLASHGVG